MAETVSYRPKAGEIPTSPGVYRFRDATGRVLYVGKAKSLRARLSNYFAPLHTLHERTRRMVLTAASVEWTVVGNEFEALQLEFTWIKEFDPPFNVQYRDDKSYPYLAITLHDDVPRVLVTRNTKIAGARYFGPVPEGVVDPRDRRHAAQGVPHAQLHRHDLQAGAADRASMPPRRHRQVRRPLRRPDQPGGPQGHRPRLRLVHGRKRFAVRRPARAQENAASAEQGLRGGPPATGTSWAPCRWPSRRTPSCSATTSTRTSSGSRTTNSPPRYSSSSSVAAASGASRAGWSTRSSTSSFRSWSRACCRTPTTRRMPPPREIIVPALPDDAAELEQWLTNLRADAVRGAGRGLAQGRPARREGGAGADGRDQRQECARALQGHGAARTSRHARRRSRTSRRRSAWPTPRCAWSATTCRI